MTQFCLNSDTVNPFFRRKIFRKKNNNLLLFIIKFLSLSDRMATKNDKNLVLAALSVIGNDYSAWQ